MPKHLEQALVIHREIGDRRGEGNVLGNLGRAFTALDEPKKAIQFYEQALVIAREIGDRFGEGLLLFNSTFALVKLNDLTQVEIRSEAALQIYESIGHPEAAKVRSLLEKLKRRKDESETIP